MTAEVETRAFRRPCITCAVAWGAFSLLRQGSARPVASAPAAGPLDPSWATFLAPPCSGGRFSPPATSRSPAQLTDRGGRTSVRRHFPGVIRSTFYSSPFVATGPEAPFSVSPKWWPASRCLPVKRSSSMGLRK
jgi:hypothetical protein